MLLLLTDPPSVTLSVQPQTVTEGAKVLFLCSASANPEITGYRFVIFLNPLIFEMPGSAALGSQLAAFD